MSEAFKTDILRQYPFPDHNKEKFCAESLVWNRMALKYNIKYYFNKAIYYCEYLPDGLSARSVSLRRRSPENTLTLYAELSKAEIDFIYKIRACINFWRFMRFDKLGLVVSHRMISFNSICMAPIGIICHIIDSIKMYRSL